VSLLWIAAAQGHIGVVEILLNTETFDVNSRSITGRSPIFWAATKGYESIVELLLKSCANPTCTDDDRQTPLSMAK
jgi:ankyrin repeat protein